MKKVGCYEFMAEPFHCDFSGRLFMGHLGNHLLNAADFHSTDRGFGMKYLLGVNRAWVLSRLAIEMTEMPPMYTRFNVETWVELAMRFFTSRNFAVVGVGAQDDHGATDASGQSSDAAQPPKVYGYGRSIWAMIDTQTRQPTDILSMNDGAINQWIEPEKACPIEKGGRVKMTDAAQLVRSIDTFYNDVDINGHINSVKYIEHVLDLWPLEWYREHAIRRFEIAYVAEAHAGDRLSFFREQTADADFCVRIVKTTAAGDAPTEVCRAKVSFRS